MFFYRPYPALIGSPGPVGRTPSGESLMISFGHLEKRLERAQPGERILIDK